jgi:sugar/nucleoside kinase (ribokinase family)
MGETTLVAMDTMNFWIDTARDALLEVLSRVDLLFINDEEAIQLSDESSVLGAARRVLQWGPKYLVIKRGEYGAVLFGPETCLFVPAVLLENVVDPTGAGDTFAGGFMGYLAGQNRFDRPSLAGALIAGTVKASFSVEAFSVEGICGLAPSKIDARRAMLENMIKF